MRILTLIFLISCGCWSFGQEASLPENLKGVHDEVSRTAVAKKVSIMVKDMRTMKVVPHFTIDFSSCGHPTYRSSEQGVFSMETQEGFACYVRIAKTGYANLDLLIDYNAIDGDKKTYNVFLSRSHNYFHGTVKDSVDAHLYLKDAQIELTCENDQQVQRVQSNIHGEFSVYLRPNRRYTMTIECRDYKRRKFDFHTGEKVDPNLLKGMYLQPLVTKLKRGRSGTAVAKKESSRGKDIAYRYFSVQILSRQLGKLDMGKHRRRLGSYGEIFMEEKDGIKKVKVGKFFDRLQAEQVLRKIRAEKGYADAFLTQSIPARSKVTSSQPVSQDSSYMVRLASYLNPKLFDGKSVAHLGNVKALEKDQWTIMLLDGFDSLNAAMKASEAAKMEGFKAAYVVLWEDGALRRAR